jgi:hypothetical protein
MFSACIGVAHRKGREARQATLRFLASVSVVCSLASVFNLQFQVAGGFRNKRIPWKSNWSGRSDL